MKLFEQLVKSGLIKKWATMLDWYFDGKKFDKSKWGKSSSYRYTMMIKKSLINNDYVEYDKRLRLSFEKYNSSYDKGRNSIIVFSNSEDCFCKDFVRHIRNGIAHGNTNCSSINGTLFITIRDYDNSRNIQTAYIHMPLDYILKLFQCYNNCKAQ